MFISSKIIVQITYTMFSGSTNLAQSLVLSSFLVEFLFKYLVLGFFLVPIQLKILYQVHSQQNFGSNNFYQAFSSYQSSSKSCTRFIPSRILVQITYTMFFLVVPISLKVLYQVHSQQNSCSDNLYQVFSQYQSSLKS